MLTLKEKIILKDYSYTWEGMRPFSKDDGYSIINGKLVKGDFSVDLVGLYILYDNNTEALINGVLASSDDYTELTEDGFVNNINTAIKHFNDGGLLGAELPITLEIDFVVDDEKKFFCDNHDDCIALLKSFEIKDITEAWIQYDFNDNLHLFNHGKILEFINNGELICPCGNTPESSGFQPCDDSGSLVEPDQNSNWNGLYKCERCSRIMNLSAGKFDNL